MIYNDKLLIIFVAVTILEALLFATPQFGWSSYVYVLIDKGFYSEKCSSNLSLNTDCNTSLPNFSDWINCNMTNTGKIERSNSRLDQQCKLQQESLNFLFSIAIATVFGLIAVWGIFVVKFGFVAVKILSVIFGVSGNVMLAFTSPENVWIIAPGIFCIGFAGQGLVMVNMKITSYIPFGVGLYSAFLMGAANSSVLAFLIVKVAHDNGISDRYTFLGFAALYAVLGGTSAFFHKLFQRRETKLIRQNELHVSTSCNTLTTMASDDIITTPDIPDSLSSIDKSGVHVIQVNIPPTDMTGMPKKQEIKVSTENNTIDTLSRRNASRSKLSMTSQADLNAYFENQTLRQSLCQTVTFTCYIWYAIILMSLFTYIGMINGRLEEDFSDRVSYFTNILGNILLAAILLAFIPGSVAECQQKICTGRGSLKEAKLKQQVLGLTLTSLLALSLNGMTLIRSEAVLYIEFVFLTLLRLFFHTSFVTFLVSTYPIRHSGFIYGLGGTISGLVTTLQYVFFRWYNAYPGSHLHVRICLTLLVAVTFLHPIAIYYKTKVPTRNQWKGNKE